MTDEQLSAIEQRAAAAFINAARNDVPALIAEVRRLRDLVAELEEMKVVAARVDQSWRRNYCDCVNERNAAEDEAKELRAGLDEYKQYEQIAIDNAYTKDTVMNAKRDEIKRLLADIERIGRERDDMSRVCPICGRFVLGADRKRSRRMK